MHKMIYQLTALCSISICAFGQSAWNAENYTTIDLQNFRAFKPFGQNIDIKDFDFRLANAAVYYVTNEIRVKKRLDYLPYNKNLEVAAYFHSLDMAEKKYFDHINKKNTTRKTPTDRASLAGIANPYPAENITEGFILDYKSNAPVYVEGPGMFSYKSGGELIQTLTYLQLAEKLLDDWMNSPPHRENILSKNNRALGCGVAIYIDKAFNDMPKVKATQLFQQYETIKTGTAKDTF
jgi:uncharacterized protein YkwD